MKRTNTSCGSLTGWSILFGITLIFRNDMAIRHILSFLIQYTDSHVISVRVGSPVLNFLTASGLRFRHNYCICKMMVTC
jgi:hypothetical protein